MSILMIGRNKGELIFGCDNIETLDLAQSVTGGRKVRNRYQIEMHQRCALNLFQYIKDIEYESVKSLITMLMVKYKKRIENIDKIKKEDARFDYEYKGTYPEVMAHQKVMFNAVMYTDSCALLADPGTCKTGPYIWAVDKRIQTGKIKKCLVITLSHLKENVMQEVMVQAPHLRAVALYDRPTARKILHKEYKVKKYNRDYDMYVASYESMFSMVEIFDDDYFDMVILDEAHRIGSPGSRQTRTIIDKFENTKYKYIITGSLNANNLMSFFMPYRFLGGDIAPVSSYATYRAQHMMSVDPDGYVWVPRTKWDVEITSKLIGSIAVMFKKEDCLDLPPLIREYLYCDIFGDQRRVYEELKTELLTTIDDICGKCDKARVDGMCDNKCEQDISAKNALVLVRKLQQITSGFYTNTRYEVDLEGHEENISNIIYFENNAKIGLLLEAMSQIHRKTIIWSYSIPAIGLIVKAVEGAYGKDSYLTCYGAQNAFDQVNRFRDGNEQWMIANPSKMGTGQNIQFSSYQIFFDNSFSFIQKEQAEARQHRQGQLEKVTVIELIARRTVDERIVRVIDDKKDLSLTLSQWSKVFRRCG